MDRGVKLDHSTIYRWVQCYAAKIMGKKNGTEA